MRRQTSDYRYAANQANPLQAQRQSQAAQESRQAASRQFAPSAFGESMSGLQPGQTIMNRSSIQRINQQTGRQQCFIAQGQAVQRANKQWQQQQQQQQQRPLSLSQMSNFIRTQPGGKAFMDEGERFAGQRFNFEQSLSRSGAAMASRNGELPPELMQMAVPFRPSAKATQQRRAQQEYWRNVEPGASQQRKPRTWYESQQASMIQNMQSEERNLSQRQTEQQREQALLENALSMGVPYRRSGNKGNNIDASKAKSSASAIKDDQQRRRVKPTEVRVRQAPPPPPVRLVSAAADGAQSSGNAEAKVASEDFIAQMQASDAKCDPTAACVDGTCPTAHLAGTHGPRQSRIFQDGAKVDDDDDAGERAQQPSALFAPSVADIQRSVEQVEQRRRRVQFAPQEQAAEAMPTLPVSQTKRRVVKPEIIPLEDGSPPTMSPTQEDEPALALSPPRSAQQEPALAPPSPRSDLGDTLLTAETLNAHEPLLVQ